MARTPIKKSQKKPSDKSKNTEKRSKSEQKSKKSTIEVCAVCLSELNADYAFLNCKHKFCSLECARGWWKFNANCPYCREQIVFIEATSGHRLTRDEISEQSSQNDSDFIPRCEQCWADITQDEEKRVCLTCSSNFIHKRCLMFNAKFWKCNDCLENVDDKGRQIYPTIPYNPIIHYLLMRNFK